jgi:hypothetical protein
MFSLHPSNFDLVHEGDEPVEFAGLTLESYQSVSIYRYLVKVTFPEDAQLEPWYIACEGSLPKLVSASIGGDTDYFFCVWFKKDSRRNLGPCSGELDEFTIKMFDFLKQILSSKPRPPTE